MGQKTEIPWCHHTLNPWYGCARVSAGCGDRTGGGCYAESMARRFKGKYGTWGVNGRRVVASDAMWRQPLKWDKDAAKAGERRRVFCASMADVFERIEDDHPDARAVAYATERLFDMIGRTPNLDWLLLTKRPEHVAANVEMVGGALDDNVWLGVSVENQEAADKRIPILLELQNRYEIPVAFLSVEPMLGPVKLPYSLLCMGANAARAYLGLKSCVWVICGGESGAHARPMDVQWALDLQAQCRDADVPFFMKQFSQTERETNLPAKNDYKNFSRFPVMLQVRQFPR